MSSRPPLIGYLFDSYLQHVSGHRASRPSGAATHNRTRRIRALSRAPCRAPSRATMHRDPSLQRAARLRSLPRRTHAFVRLPRLPSFATPFGKVNGLRTSFPAVVPPPPCSPCSTRPGLSKEPFRVRWTDPGPRASIL